MYVKENHLSRPRIIIADPDERYISTLEYAFITEFNDVDLEFITDKNFFDEYFGVPRTAEILAVSDAFYSRELQKHNINNVFVLSNEPDSGETEDLNIHRVYKYSGVKEIFSELTYRSRNVLDASQKNLKEAQIIALFSAIGGSGKTSLGMGLAYNLALNHRRVLYVNTETIQSYNCFLNDATTLDFDGIRALKSEEKDVYNNIFYYLKTYLFKYVPALGMPLESLNLQFDVYSNLISGAKKSGDYDYIIVDIESGYDPERMNLLQKSDRAIIVINQDELSIKKTEFLLKNITVRDKEKFCMVCTKYKQEQKNYYLESDLFQTFSLKNYIPYIDNIPLDAKGIGVINEIKALAYLFM